MFLSHVGLPYFKKPRVINFPFTSNNLLDRYFLFLCVFELVSRGKRKYCSADYSMKPHRMFWINDILKFSNPNKYIDN